MKNELDLMNMGLVEMNASEMEEVDGGGIFGAIIGFVAGAALALFSETVTINGNEVSGSDNWFAAGLIGAAAGAAIIPI